MHLNASIDCVQFLLKQGLAFRSHDESNNSTNKGNYLEILQFLADHNEGISNLAEKMVKTKKNVLYPLVYRLITLTLILLVAIASVERAFLI
ncbi:hypothetical protein P3X46_027272 [Hevea brasiliensis]|uniref:DUF4371 domain-containing protein n=1 Tax=Hevea brasiliensis TaxID=3981 RepID=A0ABQ9L0V4_HEVBR|nr:hypothetical protein P3X46_027272 [Hevea brasiliensis]